MKVDVRLVSATLRNLEAEVAAGRFRADLYYRLSIVPLTVPPLRERPEDILPLARYFVRRCAERLRLPVGGLTRRRSRRYAATPWPGNVRELENTIERAAVPGESTLIDLQDLPPELAYARGPSACLPPSAAGKPALSGALDLAGRRRPPGRRAPRRPARPPERLLSPITTTPPSLRWDRVTCR